MANLSIRNVTMRFPMRRGPDVTALDNVSLDIPDRHFSVIVGPSGCGKSTLLRMVAGLDAPTAGTLALDGEPITGPSKDRGMVFQTYTLFPWLSVRDNVEFGLSLAGMRASERAEISGHYIAQVGLNGFETAYPSQLSGGMRQRVAIARALANDPKVLLMDEPFGALDSQTRTLMQELLLKIWEENHKTVMFITHDIDEALLLGDRVYVMTARPGRVREEIPVAFERPRSLDLLTSAAFVEAKRGIMAHIREEAMRAAAQAS